MTETHIPPNFTERVCYGVNALNITTAIREFFMAWIRAEGGTAKWNPLNSTLWVQNFTFLPNYNSIPVRNYVSPNAGVAATVLTLSQRMADGTLKYGKIVNALQNNYRTNESAVQMVENCRSQIKLWGTNPDLMLEIISGM